MGRHPSFAFALLLATACTMEPAPPIDGGGGGDAILSDLLCTTAMCAAAPCTAYCVYQQPPAGGSCPGGLPATVSAQTVKACAGLCGFYSPQNTRPTSPGYCWHYDPSLPGGCQTPTCGWNTACEVHSGTFAADQAVICPSTESCFNGLLPADMGVVCDLAGAG